MRRGEKTKEKNISTEIQIDIQISIMIDILNIIKERRILNKDTQSIVIKEKMINGKNEVTKILFSKKTPMLLSKRKINK